MELVLAWHIDADSDIERALLYDKGEQAARISQGVEAGNRVLESWVLRSHGRMLSEEGVRGSAQLPADYLEELPSIVEQVEGATSARMHVGVGSEPSEAVVACKVATERGGDPAIVLYTPDLSEEARQLDEMSDDEADAVEVADDGTTGGTDAAVGMAKAENQREPGEASQVAAGQLSPSAAQPSPPPSPSISAGSPSPQQGQPQGQPAPGGEPSEEDILSAIGQVLTQFKAQVPFFEQQVKSANPQAYAAVMGMMQGMIALAQRVAGGGAESTPPAAAAGGEGQPVQKAEEDIPEPNDPEMVKFHKEHPEVTMCEAASIIRRRREVRKTEFPTRESLDPSSWHVRYKHQFIPGANPEAASYLTQKGKYTATPSVYTQYGSQDEAVQHLREVAQRHSRSPEQYQAVQGVGPVLKGEIDPETGESTKVEVEPHQSMPSMENLRKLYDTVSGSSMSMAEVPMGGGMDFQQFANGFYHERSEHPHLDDHQTSLTVLQHMREDPQYYTKMRALEESGMLGKDEQPAARHHVVLPPGSRGIGAHARSVKVVEPVSGKTSWHQVSVGQKMSGDGHTLSPRVGECPSADSPEKRAQDAGLVGAPTTAQEEPPQTPKLG